MRALVVDRVGPDRVSDREEAAERVVEILRGDLERLRAAVLDVFRVRAGEAVRLLFGDERRKRAVEDAVALLDRVAELVCHDDGEGERPELVEQLIGQVVGVPRDEVALWAVEGVLRDVLVVGGTGLATVRRRILRSVGELAARDRIERLAVQLRELGLVERLDVVDRLLDDHVVVVRPERLAAGAGVGGVSYRDAAEPPDPLPALVVVVALAAGREHEQQREHDAHDLTSPRHRSSSEPSARASGAYRDATGRHLTGDNEAVSRRLYLVAFVAIAVIAGASIYVATRVAPKDLGWQRRSCR